MGNQYVRVTQNGMEGKREASRWTSEACGLEGGAGAL